MALADVDDHPTGPEHSCRDESPIEDQVRARAHEEAILLAPRLTFGAVDDDHRLAARALRHGLPLHRGGEGGAAAAGQAGPLQGTDEARPEIGDPSQASQMIRVRLRARADLWSLEK